ncbi:MAG: RidA family protein [Rhodospirillaceae bacterium]|nr:RidA family protein [Rhodospirillaceae bacterium]
MPRQAVGAPGTLPDGSANPLSTAVRAGDFVFVSGLMAKDAAGRMVEGDITTQTEAIFIRLKAVLAGAGLGLDDVVKCTVWLTRAEDFAAFNAAYARQFAGPPPARSTVRADLLLPGALIELEAVCYRPVAPP